MEITDFIGKQALKVAANNDIHLNLAKETPDGSKGESIQSIKVLIGLMESINVEKKALKGLRPVNRHGHFLNADRELSSLFTLELQRRKEKFYYNIRKELYRQCQLYLDSYTYSEVSTVFKLHVGPHTIDIGNQAFQRFGKL